MNYTFLEQLLDDNILGLGLNLFLDNPFPITETDTDTDLFINLPKFSDISSISNGPVITGPVLQNNTMYRPVICLSKDLEEVLYYRCNCSSGEKKHVFCQHTAALLTGYLYKTFGKDLFSQSKTILHRNGPIPDLDFSDASIFCPTDLELQQLLLDQELPSLPKWEMHTDADSFEPLHVRCSFFTLGNRISVQLMIGTQARDYHVDSIPALLSSYQKYERIMLGKKRYLLSPVTVDHSTRKLFELLPTLLPDLSQEDADNNFTDDRSFSTSGFLDVPPSSLDSLISCLDGNAIRWNNHWLEPLDLNNTEKIPFRIRRSDHGMYLLPVPIKVLAQSRSFLYLMNNDTLLRYPKKGLKNEKKFLELISGSEERFIHERDFPRFVNLVLNPFEDLFSVESEGFSCTSFIFEQPKLELYLDLPGKDLISCKAFACYENSRQKFSLFGHEEAIDIRNIREEQLFSSCLSGIFSSYDETAELLYLPCTEEQLFDFLSESIPLLQQLGDVFISENLKTAHIHKKQSMHISVKVSDENLILSLSSADYPDEDLIAILNAYRKRKKYFRLKNGDFIALEDKQQDLEQLSSLYDLSAETGSNTFTISRYRLLQTEDLLSSYDQTLLEKSSTYCSLVKDIQNPDFSAFDPPKNVAEILRSYQKEGLFWICNLKSCGFSGILADDMGLGKTLQVISFLLHEKEQGKSGDSLRTLIITPASLVYNWKNELARFAPELSVTLLSGESNLRKKEISASNPSDVWITSYDILRRDLPLYESVSFANEIIDEAQYIKNHVTKSAKAVCQINSSFRLALTGTPIENSLSELWSIFDYLMPGFLSTYKDFRKRFESPILESKDEAAIRTLQRMTTPFILRRLKKDVLKDLPDKFEKTLKIPLEEEQRQLYDARVQNLIATIKTKDETDLRKNSAMILSELTALRQLCCDPSLVYETNTPSAKLEACMQLILQSVESGHKLLLFSQFTSMLDLIEKQLKQKQISFHRLDGTTSKEERIHLVDSFAKDDVPIFLISLKAGGTGLNLTAADIVIHYDPWWNQASQNQATDRTHRIGQTQKVTVFELIAENTIEEKIQLIKQKKLQLADSIISGEELHNITLNKDALLSILSN